MADFDPEPLDGAADALHRLAAEPDVHLYLSTGSHPDAAKRWLGALGWMDAFELVLGSAPGALKGPEHYTAIIEHAGVDAEVFAAQAATVGDGQYDMSYGRDHGVRLRIGFAAGDEQMAAELVEHGATHVVHHLADAVDIILAS
jgi:phosphoglycolate phosphatase-like HAD superfamily hydrolase